MEYIPIDLQDPSIIIRRNMSRNRYDMVIIVGGQTDQSAYPIAPIAAPAVSIPSAN